MMQNKYYILDGKTAVEADLMTWARWFENAGADCVVAKTQIADVTVSTVFLGLDHQFAPSGPPLLFETMVFGGPDSERAERYSTWDEAVRGHDAMLEAIGAE